MQEFGEKYKTNTINLETIIMDYEEKMNNKDFIINEMIKKNKTMMDEIKNLKNELSKLKQNNDTKPNNVAKQSDNTKQSDNAKQSDTSIPVDTKPDNVAERKSDNNRKNKKKNDKKKK